MQITAHFTSQEFDCHDGTPYPVEWYEERLRPLCDMLEIIRSAVGFPVLVLSGFRTPTYNARVGGMPKSQHLDGRAADITIPSMLALDVHAAIHRLVTGQRLPLVHGLGAYPTFTHVDIRPGPGLAQWSGSRLTT